MATTSGPEAATEGLRVVVWDAIRRFGGQADGMFNSACFAASLLAFGLTNSLLDGAEIARILGGLPYVVALEGGCHWRYGSWRDRPSLL